MVTLAKKLWNAQDYFRWELQQARKHELIDNRISVSYTHLTLPTNYSV